MMKLTLASSCLLGLAALGVSPVLPGTAQRSTLLTDAGASAQDGEPFEFHRYFFKEPRPLVLDEYRIGVFAPQGLGAWTSPSLVDARAVEPMGIRGWHLAGLVAPIARPTDLERVLQEVAVEGAIAFVTPVFVDDFGGPLLITPDLLVRFAQGVTMSRAESLLELAGAGRIAERDWGGMSQAYKVRCERADGLSVLRIANRLAEMPEVEFAEPDCIVTGRSAQLPPNDPYFAWSVGPHGSGTGLSGTGFDLGALKAWETTAGDPTVRVLILDTGVDPFHPDINQDPGADFTSDAGGGEPVNSCDNHGTVVAYCVSGIANNGIGASGIAPGCKSVSARTFIANSTCDASWSTQYSWTVDALEWGASQGIRITNNSNGYGAGASSIAAKYQQTKDEDGMVHFACSGNSGASGVWFPARNQYVNAVGAAHDGRRSPFSTYGPQLAFVAPGWDVFAGDRVGSAGVGTDDYCWATGTSFSSPYAAGVAALIRSLRPNLSPYGVEQILCRSAQDLQDEGHDNHTGWGLIRADRAIDLLSRPPIRPAPVGWGGAGRPAEIFRACGAASISDDGNLVAFSSDSPSLVPGDTNGKRDIFVKDRTTFSVTRVSVVDLTGQEADDDSSEPCLSGDGRYVAFVSHATNLVAGDTNGRPDVFRHDLQTRRTIRVSVLTGGGQATGANYCGGLSMSTDGSSIAFSCDGNLYAPSTHLPQVFLHQPQTQTTVLVSREASGTPGNSLSLAPVLSDDGMRIVYASSSSNLVAGDANGSEFDVFLYDVIAGTTSIVSVGTTGQQSDENWGCHPWPSLSGDGTRVSFTTPFAFDPSDTNGLPDVYVRDLVAGTTFRGSVDASGAFPNGLSIESELSQDGRYLVFESAATDLVAGGDANPHVDVFLKDLQTGTVTRVSVGSAGQQPFGDCSQPWISPNGDLVGFTSDDDALTAGDALDGYADVYLRDVVGGATELITGGS